MTDVAIFGARGYLGRTLVKLLVDHPWVEGVRPVSGSADGQAFGDVVPSMRQLDCPAFAGPRDHEAAADVVFLATGSARAEEAVAERVAPAEADLVVDLSRAHRAAALAGEGPWTYGLPELPGHVEPGATHVANPGCYPTAALLAIGPLLRVGLVDAGPLVVDGKSGVSGAGATPRGDLHFPEANESTRAYDVDDHDHQAEIQAASRSLAAARGPAGWPVRFTPHLVPQGRGLLATVYAPVSPEVDDAELEAAYEKVFPPDAGVVVGPEPDTGHVRGSNRAHVAWTMDRDAGLLVARCAIDNLLKGGAGTAVHNMNVALDLPPRAGLPGAGVAP